jgi:long-chain fatty acid transport protein
MRARTTTLIRAAMIAAVAGYGGTAGAAGFALMEQSASGLGNAYAGQAAAAQDATTVFVNPAGMSFLPGPQVVLGGAAIDVSAKFSSNGSTIPGLATATGSQLGGNGGNAGGVVPIANFYATAPLGDRFSIGFGVNVPFGLQTEYDDSWVGRFQGIKSDLTTINYNPSVAYKVSDTVSIGAGVSYQFLQIDLTNAIATPFGEGTTELTGQDGAWGWNLGAIFQVSPDMRIGASYRSRLDYTVKGSVNTTFNATGTPVPNGSFSTSADVTLPDMFSLSVMQKFDIVNTANNATRDTLALNFQNAWRLSLGLDYHHTESWTFKGGIAWDQSPVQDQYRTVRLPDNDRYWFALGATYRPSKALAFDVGYAYIWLPTTSIDSTHVQPGVPAALGTSTVNGEYRTFVNVFAVQVSYTF